MNRPLDFFTAIFTQPGRRATAAERLMAAERLRLVKKPAGSTPTARCSWREIDGVLTCFTDEVVSPADRLRFARYTRYRHSEKGRARTVRYNTGPAGQQANFREYMKT